MKSSRKWLWLLVVPALFSVGAITFARAQGAGAFCHGPGGHHGAQSAADVRERLDDKLDHLLDAVDATADQRARASAIADRLAPELYALMNEGRTLRGELKTQLLADTLDKARIAADQEKLSVLANKLVKTSMDGLSSVADVLTPAQRRQIADKLASMHL